ncbi:hypothetical protein MPSEU_000476600 [Mayamaea pseudoterrestris]|nr:hypothetical protein MPSEU_000476600 [Mayamaea pseudoterrestris]
METLSISKIAVSTLNLPMQLPSQMVPIEEKERPNFDDQGQKTVTQPLTSAPPNPLLLVRMKQLSEPLTTSRRSIFSNFWRGRKASKSNEVELTEPNGQSNSGTPTPQSPPVPSIRARSRSISAIAKTPEDARLCVDFFSPPVVRSVLNHHEHFLPLDRLGQNHMLPVLPLPLRRFYSDGRSSPLQGMYPLLKPESILKRHSSYGSSKAEDTLAMLKDTCPWGQILQVSTITDSSTSLQSDTPGINGSHSSSSAAKRRAVSFDPRVTVCEFEDSIPRDWFSEAELDRFRAQTVMRAQAYLMDHPEMIRAYQQPYLDPITGTMRKKALYSMPCLRSSASDVNGRDDVNDDVTESEGTLNVQDAAQARHLMMHHALERAAKQHVQDILIVDRNNVCLDLFHRSLKQIFPHARIGLADSAQKALMMFRRELIEKKKGFDIVIAEEALYVPPTNSTTLPITRGKSLDSMTTSAARQQQLLHSRHASLEGFVYDGPEPVRTTPSKSVAPVTATMTGTQLLSRVSREAGLLTVTSQTSPQGMLRPISCPFIPLLVVVASHSDGEKNKLLESVDLVLSKPPPLMNVQLRDLMVETLLAKRAAAKFRESSNIDAS